MSFKNAISQRQDMIKEYQRMLEGESNVQRIIDIQSQITSCQEDIAELNNGKPLFGKPKPLIRETKIIEADPERKGQQKVTILNPKPTEVIETTASNKKVGNSLRDMFQKKSASSAEESLKAKIQAAKTTRAKLDLSEKPNTK